MILDTDAKTVTFPAGATLSLTQLWAIIDVLDDDIQAEINLGLRDEEPYLCPAHQVPADARYLRHAYEIASDTRPYVYATVKLTDGTWACSCPDWVHRRSLEGECCKHIRRIGWLL